MRRLIRFTMLCLLLLSGSALSQTVDIDLDDASGAPGNTIQVPVTITGEFAAAQFDIVVDDPSLILIGFTPAIPPSGTMLDFEQINATTLRVMIYDTACPAASVQASTQAIDTGPSGLNLGDLQIQIAEAAEARDILLVPQDAVAGDDTAAPLVIIADGGTVTVQQVDNGGPIEPLTVPTVPPAGLFIIICLLLGAGLLMLHRRGINLLVVVGTASIVWIGLQPYSTLAQSQATPEDILAVILERQAPAGNEDCNADSVIDVLDIICARNAACDDDINQAPAISAIADQSVIAGDTFLFSVQASDPDGDTLSYNLTTAPSGMDINTSGQIAWPTRDTDVGDHPVTVEVVDPDGLSDSESFTVTVFAASSSVVRLSDPGNFSVVAGDTLTFTLQGASTDPDSVLSYTKQAGPAGLSVDAGSGQVSWTTTAGDLGSHTAQARVSDADGLFDEQLFIIEVTDQPETGSLANRAPGLSPIADQSMNVGTTLSIQTLASDPDGDALSYALLAAPAGMSISATGQIDFTAGVNQAGVYTITVRVSDSLGLSDTESFTLTAIGLNNAPLALDDGYDAQKGGTLSVPAAGVLANDSDPDADPLAAALVQGPAHGSLSLNDDGSFDYTPDIPAGTIGFDEKYSATSVRGAGGSTAQPLIVDLDADGIAEIIMQDGAGCCTTVITAFNGDDGSVLWSMDFRFREIHAGTLPAAADIDLDGRYEILLIGGEVTTGGTPGRKLYALEHDGQLKWMSESLPMRYFRNGNLLARDGDLKDAAISVADLDADGTPEIIVAPGVAPVEGFQAYHVWDSEGRKLDFQMAPNTRGGGDSRVEIGDLDLDGDPEIIVGTAAWHHDGTLYWSRGTQFSTGVDRSYPILANLDDDPYPELVRARGGPIAGNGNIVAWNHDGTDLWEVTRPSSNNSNSPITIADVDRDGEADILLPALQSTTDVFEVLNGSDGSVKWSQPVDTGRTGATALDLDGDGFDEVLYMDQDNTMHVWDGRDGTVKLVFDPPQTPTGNPTHRHVPVFADFDGDGDTELFTIGSSQFGAAPLFTIWESPKGDWPPMRPLWNQYRYHVTNINLDGSVPAVEPPHWLIPGLNRNMINERLPEERTETFDQFTYTASDGELSDQATVYLRVLENQNPPQILSQPDTTATVGFNYRYAPTVTDPDPGETFSFQLTSGPAGMTIDALTGLIRWTPDSTGNFGIGLVVTDAGGLSTAQTWTLVVGEPVEVPDLLGLTQAAGETALTDASLVVGRVREAFSKTFPAGQVAGQTPMAGAVAEFGAAVDLTVSRGPAPEDVDDDGDGFTENEGDCDDSDSSINPGAADPEGDAIDQNCDGVDGELNLESIELTPADSMVLSNTTIQYSAVGIRADGTAINLDGLGNFSSSDNSVAQLLGDRRVRTAAAGTATLSLSYQGITGTADINVATGVSSDDEPPLAEITSPAGGQAITAPVDVIGSISDDNLLRWELTIAAGEGAAPIPLAVGSGNINSAVIAELDPTQLMNGLYVLSLNVFDRGGNLSRANTTIEVEGDYKVGNFSLAQEDLNLPLAGLPIGIIRSYDSRDKQRGDFGIGWTLGLNSVSVNVSRTFGSGWEVLGGGRGFLLNSTDDHFVSITLPDGLVETFELQISPTTSFLIPFSFLKASLVPVGNTRGAMEIVDNSFVVIVDQQPGTVQLLDDTTFELFDPSNFKYVSEGGTEFVVNRDVGLKQLTDVNGNSLVISESGISHSSGAEVRFTRDSLNRITRITDPAGNQLRYSYDSLGDLSTFTDAAGNLTRFRYNASHGLLEVIDPLGNRAVRNDYDAEGRLTAITDVAGNRIEFTHDVAGREELIRDAAGNVQRLLLDDDGNIVVRERTVTLEGVRTVATERFEYDSNGNETVSIDADGVRTERTFDSQNNLLETVIDSAGLALTTSATYNDRGQPLSQTDELGNITTFEYDDSGNLIRTTDPLGQVSTNTYSGTGQLVASTDAAGTTTTRTYSSTGARIGVDVTDATDDLLSRTTFTVDLNNNTTSESVYRVIDDRLTPITTTFTYDAKNRLIRTTDPLGNVTQTEYDPIGQVRAEIDGLGNRTEFSYDASGRRTATRYADGTSITRSYDAVGNVIATTDELGRTTTHEYDELNRKISTTYPDGSKEQTVFSAAGREIARIDTLGQRTDFQYDSAGRRVATLLPEVIDGRNGNLVRPRQETVKDATGNALRISDNNGNTTEFTYDAAGQLIQTRFADNTTTSKIYDAVGRVVSSTDELGRTTTSEYDGLGRLLSIIQPAPESGASPVITRYSWDLTGNRLTQTDGLGRVTRFSHDLRGNQIRRTLPEGQFATATYDAAGNVAQQVDFNGQTVISSYNTRNRLIENRLSDGTIERYTYTADGQEATASDPSGTITTSYDAKARVASITKVDGQTLNYVYNAADQQISMTGPTGTIAYEYDTLGRLTAVTDSIGTTRYTYDLNGNQLSILRPNQSKTTNSHDQRNRLLSVEHRDASDNLLERFDYSYFANGQRRTVTSNDGSVETYAYDALDRLIEEIRVGNNPRNISYEYDAANNRLAKHENGITESYRYDANNRLLTAGDTRYTYDGNGNRTSKVNADGVATYRWNAKSMLVEVRTPDGEETRYRYDIKGDRVAAERSSVTENYLVNPNSLTGFPEVIEQRDGDGSVVASNTFGTDLISTDNGTPAFFHTDAIGSTRLLTNDSSGVSDTFDYKGFGELTADTGLSDTPYLFTGERFDTSLNAVYLRARYYDPELGIFLGRDRFPGMLESPVSLHPYAYANLDPINEVDPSGLLTLPDVQASLQIINTRLASISVRTCSAISTADQAALVASLLQLGFNLFIAAQSLPDNLFGHKAYFEFPISKRYGPLEKVILEISGDASKIDIKLAFSFGDNDPGQAVTVSFDKDGRFLGGLPEVSFGAEKKLIDVRFCGLDVGGVFAKVEAAGRAGTGASGGLSGIAITDASTLGVNGEIKGFLEASFADSVALEMVLFSIRGGGGNGGFTLLGFPIR